MPTRSPAPQRSRQQLARGKATTLASTRRWLRSCRAPLQARRLATDVRRWGCRPIGRTELSRRAMRDRCSVDRGQLQPAQRVGPGSYLGEETQALGPPLVPMETNAAPPVPCPWRLRSAHREGPAAPKDVPDWRFRPIAPVARTRCWGCWRPTQPCHRERPHRRIDRSRRHRLSRVICGIGIRVCVFQPPSESRSRPGEPGADGTDRKVEKFGRIFVGVP